MNELYKQFRDDQARGIDRIRAMEELQKRGVVLELPEVIQALQAIVMEIKK
jgi:hypothetical protein